MAYMRLLILILLGAFFLAAGIKYVILPVLNSVFGKQGEQNGTKNKKDK